MSKTKLTPPEDLYRIEIHTSPNYGKRAKFWDIQKYNEEWSNTTGKAIYNSVAGGLAYTKWGLWYSIRRAQKRLKAGSTFSYYKMDGTHIESTGKRL